MTPGTGDAADALAGLKVLDLSWVVAGPLIGRALADFGADVIRVESSTRIETARWMPPFYAGESSPENSSLYGTCNAGKLGIALDLSRPEGRDVVRDLARWADVVVEAFSPGRLARWGLGYDDLREGHEDLVMLSTSLQGQTGPDHELAGYGNVGASLSGFQHLVGWPDRPPVGPFGPYTDYIGPKFSLVTLLAALEYREATGQGCHIDVAQVECGIYFLSPEVAEHHVLGTVAQRAGNADREHAPHGVYPCAPEDGRDRFVAIAVRTDAEWAALCSALGLVGVPRSSSDAAVAAWTAERPAHAVEALLQAVGVPAHVVASSTDFCTDPQIEHREHLVRLPHARHGEDVVEAPRYRLSDTPGTPRRAAPDFGQHTDEVLGGILGYPAARIAELAEAGVLS
ncbi:MAG: CoA transferase [Pseudonocardia sp.]|nr:CoA transferase [Pseudonocardia sp.]